MADLWPQEFRTTVETAFGGDLNNTVFDMVSRRVENAFAIWRRRYQMTPKQELYAWEVLTWAVRNAAMDVKSREGVKHPRMYMRAAVVASMERVLHDQLAHEGFKRRADMVDVTPILRDLFA